MSAEPWEVNVNGALTLKVGENGNSRVLLNLKEWLRKSLAQSQPHRRKFEVWYLQSNSRIWEGLGVPFSTGDFIVATLCITCKVYVHMQSVCSHHLKPPRIFGYSWSLEEQGPGWYDATLLYGELGSTRKKSVRPAWAWVPASAFYSCADWASCANLYKPQFLCL